MTAPTITEPQLALARTAAEAALAVLPTSRALAAGAPVTASADALIEGQAVTAKFSGAAHRRGRRGGRPGPGGRAQGEPARRARPDRRGTAGAGGGGPGRSARWCSTRADHGAGGGAQRDRRPRTARSRCRCSTASEVRAVVALALTPWPSRRQPGAGRPGRPPAPAAVRGGLDMLHDVEMEVSAELGRTRMSVRELLSLTPGRDRRAGPGRRQPGRPAGQRPADRPRRGGRGGRELRYPDHRDRLPRHRTGVTGLFELVLRIGFSLLVVFGLMWGLARLARRPLGSGTAPVAAVGAQPPAADRGASVAVVRVADRALVLGVTDQQVSLLGEADLEDVREAPHGTGTTSRSPDRTPCCPPPIRRGRAAGWTARCSRRAPGPRRSTSCATGPRGDDHATRVPAPAAPRAGLALVLLPAAAAASPRPAAAVGPAPAPRAGADRPGRPSRRPPPTKPSINVNISGTNPDGSKPSTLAGDRAGPDGAVGRAGAAAALHLVHQDLHGPRDHPQRARADQHAAQPGAGRAGAVPDPVRHGPDAVAR